MLFNKARSFKISKPDFDNNIFVFKANKKIFKRVLTLKKYKKIFKFDLNHFVIQLIH